MEIRVHIELGLCELTEVVGYNVALAVDDLIGLDCDRGDLSDRMLQDPHHTAELLQRAGSEILEAAAKLQAWCRENPEQQRPATPTDGQPGADRP